MYSFTMYVRSKSKNHDINPKFLIFASGEGRKGNETERRSTGNFNFIGAILIFLRK